MMNTQLGCSSTLRGVSIGAQPRQLATASRATTTPSAIFTKKRPAPVVVEEKPEKKSFSLFGKKAPVVPIVEEKPAKKSFSLFNGGSKKAATKPAKVEKVDKAAEYKKRQGVGGIVAAFDFSEARSKSDAELLYDAKYGKLEGGKMTRAQYNALQRKVGGTAKDFFKTSIDVIGENTDKGYVSEEATTVPALPLLIGVVLALFGTVGYVVSQTAQ